MLHSSSFSPSSVVQLLIQQGDLFHPKSPDDTSLLCQDCPDLPALSSVETSGANVTTTTARISASVLQDMVKQDWPLRCEGRLCSCQQTGLSPTDIYQCKDCQNQFSTIPSDNGDESDSDSNVEQGTVKAEI
eukprot:scpid111643/ scgid10729/ 